MSADKIRPEGQNETMKVAHPAHALPVSRGSWASLLLVLVGAWGARGEAHQTEPEPVPTPSPDASSSETRTCAPVETADAIHRKIRAAAAHLLRREDAPFRDHFDETPLLPDRWPDPKGVVVYLYRTEVSRSGAVSHLSLRPEWMVVVSPLGTPARLVHLGRPRPREKGARGMHDVDATALAGAEQRLVEIVAGCRRADSVCDNVFPARTPEGLGAYRDWFQHQLFLESSLRKRGLRFPCLSSRPSGGVRTVESDADLEQAWGQPVTIVGTYRVMMLPTSARPGSASVPSQRVAIHVGSRVLALEVQDRGLRPADEKRRFLDRRVAVTGTVHQRVQLWGAPDEAAIVMPAIVQITSIAPAGAGQ